MTAKAGGPVAGVAVSVVIAIRDGAEHVPGLRAMLEAQEIDAVEVVLVDDASEDDTGDLLQAWADHPDSAGRVRVLRLPHQRGAAAARRAGLVVARGRWVWFADADDRFDPWLLRRALELAGTSGADVVCFRARAERADGQPHPVVLYGTQAPEAPEVHEGRAAADAVLTGAVMGYLWDKLYSRELVSAAFDGSVDLRTHEDLLLLLRVLQHSPRLVVAGDAPYAYVVRTSSLSNARRPSFRDLQRCAEEAERMAALHGCGAPLGTFLARYVGLAALDDAVRKGGREDVREAAALCGRHLRRATPLEVARDHGWRLAGRVTAARCAPVLYGEAYRLARWAVRQLRERS